MKTRAITGFFFVIVMLGSVLCGQYVFSVFYLLLALLTLREFFRLISQTGLQPNLLTGYINGFILYAAFAGGIYLFATGEKNILFFLPMITMPAIFFQELYKKSAIPITNIAYTFLGLIFTVAPFIFFHALAFMGGSFNYHLPLAFLIMLWAYDTGAYLVGIRFGRTKLFERHSPKKTWEGFFGGIAISICASVLIAHFFTDLDTRKWISIAIIICCFGTMGDLVESMFKRSIHIKDSGEMLPGHGGLLDRFDGFLMAAPIVYAYLYLI
jgi:phosphatidate cytidylyltransferase